MMKERIKKVLLDRKETYKFKCPNCDIWGYLDDDQANGRISIQCKTEGCTFHKTINIHKLYNGVTT